MPDKPELYPPCENVFTPGPLTCALDAGCGVFRGDLRVLPRFSRAFSLSSARSAAVRSKRRRVEPTMSRM
jgi:hypothetical protein